ncbi:MAG: NAD-dependent epimerase/dehydratase family protein, partial [Bacteroidales bacterium]|nr:NAD-dependent epimerase/dehydratase family protein [Candidatus Liminaster caballi]
MKQTDLDIQEFITCFPLALDLKGHSILVTGAGGLIGRTLVRCLRGLDEHYALGITLFCPRHQELTAWLTDNANHADYVIHLACPTASREMVEKPVEVIEAITDLTKLVLEFVRRTNATMVYASSMEVYGINHTDELITEDYQGYLDPLQVRSSYPMAKRMAECMCHCYACEYGVNAKIARLVQTFGAGISHDDQRVFAQFARSVVDGRDIILHTEGKTSRKYLYLTDAVSALLYIMLKGTKGEAYNAAHPDSYVS